MGGRFNSGDEVLATSPAVFHPGRRYKKTHRQPPSLPFTTSATGEHVRGGTVGGRRGARRDSTLTKPLARGRLEEESSGCWLAGSAPAAHRQGAIVFAGNHGVVKRIGGFPQRHTHRWWRNRMAGAAINRFAKLAASDEGVRVALEIPTRDIRGGSGARRAEAPPPCLRKEAVACADLRASARWASQYDHRGGARLRPFGGAPE